jgi:hypothetical protein
LFAFYFSLETIHVVVRGYLFIFKWKTQGLREAYTLAGLPAKKERNSFDKTVKKILNAFILQDPYLAKTT